MAFLPLGRAGIDHTVIIIRDCDDPGSQRDIYPFEPFGIAGAVPFFMMAPDQVDDAVKLFHVFQHAAAGNTVAFVLGHFPGAQIGEFIQYAVGNA